MYQISGLKLQKLLILKHFALIIDHPVCDKPSFLTNWLPFIQSTLANKKPISRLPYRVKEKLYFTGVMVGATADMVLQPYGAVTAGL